MSIINIIGILGCFAFLSWLIYKVGEVEGEFSDEEIRGGILK